MVTDPISQSLYKKGLVILKNEFSSLLSSVLYGQNVISINFNAIHTNGLGLGQNAISLSLFDHRSGYCKVVVSTIEKGMGAKLLTEIDSDVKIAFRGSPFSKNSHSNLIGLALSQSIAISSCLRNLRTQRRRDRKNIMLP